MQNLVNQLDLLKKMLDTEAVLRAATQTELVQGIQNGPMHQAHDASIADVIAAANALIKASNEG